MSETYDNNYCWRFPVCTEIASDSGYNEAMSKNFSKSPYASIIREAIQNSLDVRLDPFHPVEVYVEINQFDYRSFPQFMTIKDHIKDCFDYYKDYAAARAIYSPMLDYLKSLTPDNPNVNYIKISDYNTVGMKYVKDDHNNPFYAFARAAGVSHKKDSAAGGCFGFGKAAYYGLSPIRTLLISTLTDEGGCYFEGVASLCTHRHNGQKVFPIGYYDCNAGYPVTCEDDILRRFRRKERNGLKSGTDFNIIGLDLKDKSKNDIYEEMVYAVLRNFWLSVYHDQLSVKIGQIEISSQTITYLMDRFFSGYDDNHHTMNYNPRAYYEAIVSAGKDKNYKLYQLDLNNDSYYQSIFCEEKLDMGKVLFYTFKSRGGSNHILYMRSPEMLVQRQLNNSANGYFGVLLCNNGKCNDLLRMIENPAHTEWDTRNLTDKTYLKVIEHLLQSIKSFVQESLQDLMGVKDAKYIDMVGMNQYCYIPTDIEEDDDDDIPEAMVGDPTGNFKDEGSSMTTGTEGASDNPTPDSKKRIGEVVVKRAIKGSPSDDGGAYGGKGNHPRKRRGQGMGDNPSKRYRPDGTGYEGRYLVELPVQYRCLATEENGKIVHHLFIHSPETVNSAQIYVYVGGDDKTDKLNLLESNVGSVSENGIKDLSLSSGRNKIEIKFVDNIKHSIKLKVLYENK